MPVADVSLLHMQLPLLVSGIAFIAGAAVMAAAVDIGMLVAGRVLLGIGVGLASLVVPMFNAECAPAHLRGAMNIVRPVLELRAELYSWLAGWLAVRAVVLWDDIDCMTMQ